MCRESREEAACGFLGTSGKFSEGLAFERRLRLSWVAPDSKGVELGKEGQLGVAEELRLFIWLLPGALTLGQGNSVVMLGRRRSWVLHWYIPNGTHIGEVRAARGDIDERHRPWLQKNVL